MILGMSPRVGGVETYIMNCLKNIDRSRFEFYFPYYTEISYREELIELGGKLLKINASRHNPVHYVKYVNRLFEQIGFDAVYYNTCDIMSMDMIMFGKKHGVPVRIIHSHNSSNIVKPNLLHYFTEKWCRKHLDEYATKLLACSKVAGDWMFGGRTFEIVNNGIDVVKFTFSQKSRQQKRDELGLKDKFVIGFVGSIWDQKNPLFLIDLFKHVHEREPNAVLLVIGDGELRKEMQNRVEAMNLSKEVRFLGVRSDVPQLMCAMDHFVLPSKFEGLPFVLVEAQCSGLSCTTSNNVSIESDLTGEVNFLHLDSPMDEWVEKIINSKSAYRREEYPRIIAEKGYDIKTTTNLIESYLVGKEKGEPNDCW